jgi:hypothetical protein
LTYCVNVCKFEGEKYLRLTIVTTEEDINDTYSSLFNCFSFKHKKVDTRAIVEVRGRYQNNNILKGTGYVRDQDKNIVKNNNTTNINNWTVDELMRYFEKDPILAKYAHIFLENDIDGEVLLTDIETQLITKSIQIKRVLKKVAM